MGGVSHLEKRFTPTVKMWKSGLTAKQKAALHRVAKNKAKVVSESARQFTAAGGDQVAEARLGAVKNSMRRASLLGRLNTTPTRKKIHVLSAAHLVRCPGLEAIMRALRNYRLACSSGQVAISRRDAFNAERLKWLA